MSVTVHAVLAWADCNFSLWGNSHDLYSGSDISVPRFVIIIAQRGTVEHKLKKNMFKNIKKITMLLFVATTMMTTSCSKDDSSSSLYYVKYEAEHFRGDTWYYRLVEYVTPDGIQQAYTYDGDIFTAYAGPFHKGDHVQISLQRKSGDRSWMAISVKENDSPFVVKKSALDSLQIGYDI